MYTRCPNCQTLFRITTRQLKAARGKVRCGECQLPFDAIDYLINRDELSKSEQKAAAKLERNESPQWQLPFDNEHPERASDTPGRELAEKTVKAAPTDDQHSAAAEVAVETALFETPPAATPEKGVSEPAPPAAPPPPDELPDALGNKAATSVESLATSRQEAIAIAAEGLAAPRENEPTEPPEKAPHSTAIPIQPRYSLPKEEPPPRRARLAWTVASLLLVAVLAAQLALLNRATLLDNYPATKPWLEQLCQLARCAQPTKRDLMAIEMSERTVLTHPEYQKALLITATLVNKAPFAQPYPMVELIMTNLEQKPVASRRFLPAEYLKDGNPDGVFAAGAAIRLRLEVVDPGEQAVGFEFTFH